jgi:hypothetical protein
MVAAATASASEHLKRQIKRRSVLLQFVHRLRRIFAVR